MDSQAGKPDRLHDASVCEDVVSVEADVSVCNACRHHEVSLSTD